MIVIFFLSLLKKTENVFEEADCLNQAIKGKGAGPLFNLSGSNSRNGIKLGKHAYGSYLLNENPAAEGGGKSQRRESLTLTSNRSCEA